MEVFLEFLEKIENPDHRSRMEKSIRLLIT
mgnify:CR=1 FL=1